MPHFLETRSGGPSPLDERLYSEMKRVAAACLRGERAEHTFTPTDLVHEACLRLRKLEAGGEATTAEIRRMAARTMRRVLVDHARRRAAEKRDSGRRVSFDEDADRAVERDAYVVALDHALADLAALDDGLAAVVDLLFFGGCTVEEAAHALGVSPRTVKRRWRLAKGWLHREITSHDGE
jgi:RNA polymerase sigma factor (TIGR02999 family)